MMSDTGPDVTPLSQAAEFERRRDTRFCLCRLSKLLGGQWGQYIYIYIHTTATALFK